MPATTTQKRTEQIGYYEPSNTRTLTHEMAHEQIERVYGVDWNEYHDEEDYDDDDE